MSSSSGASPAKKSPSRLQALKAAKKAALKAAGGSPVIQGVVRDPFERALEARERVRGPTGLIYHEDMLLHHCPWDDEHIESPARLSQARARIEAWGLWDRCRLMSTREAEPEEILSAHSQRHLDELLHLSQAPTDQVQTACLRNYQGVYMNEHSFRAAKLAAGGAIDLAEAVASGQVQNGLALVRPPGHHAMREECNGFSLLNSVALAAHQVLKKRAGAKILIVDVDVHHGQGIQQMFYDDPRVLYLSIHRYENGDFWPHLRESQFDWVGGEAARGLNVNIPLNQTQLTDADYLHIFHQIILPLAYEFEPTLVLVAAGFDAALGCPEGEMKLSPPMYGHMVQALMSLAYGQVAVIMEGGYFVESLADAAALALKALLGDELVGLGRLAAITDSVLETSLNVVSAQKAHWKLLGIQEEYDISQYDPSMNTDCHEPLLIYKGDVHLEHRSLNMARCEPEISYASHSPERMAELMLELGEVRKRYPAMNASLDGVKRVALAYDELMTRHANLDEPNHPERPGRILNIYKTHEKYGLLDRSDLMHVPSRKATAEEIYLCHDAAHFEAMSQIPDKSQAELETLADTFDSIYMNPDTFDCALLSCGSLLNVVDAVMDGRAQKGVAIIRPPGHHAESDEPCGFCIFNNVAIAAKYALQYHAAKRVLILDWDVHHGNGIQNMFYDNPNVLYISIHRFDGGAFFPGRMEANYDYPGEKQGEGFNINIPWNGAGMGDPEYSLALFNVILPVAHQFEPDLVLVSAGFDAAQGDPLGKCSVTPEMYGHIVHHLQRLADGKVIVALEGGYNLNSIALSMTMCTKALLGDPLPPVSILRPPKSSAVESVRNVMQAHAPYWNSLRIGSKKLPDSFEELTSQAFKTPRKARQPQPAFPSPLPLEFPRPVSDSLYIPSEYGQFYGSTVVNTISSSAHSSDGINLVDSKKKDGSGDPSDALARGLDGMELASHRFSSPSLTDYVPFQYGNYNFSSPSVNTISKSSRSSACQSVDSKKKSDD